MREVGRGGEAVGVAAAAVDAGLDGMVEGIGGGGGGRLLQADLWEKTKNYYPFTLFLILQRVFFVSLKTVS